VEETYSEAFSNVFSPPGSRDGATEDHLIPYDTPAAKVFEFKTKKTKMKLQIAREYKEDQRVLK
jgi:hypothetical protein